MHVLDFSDILMLNNEVSRFLKQLLFTFPDKFWYFWNINFSDSRDIIKFCGHDVGQADKIIFYLAFNIIHRMVVFEGFYFEPNQLFCWLRLNWHHYTSKLQFVYFRVMYQILSVYKYALIHKIFRQRLEYSIYVNLIVTYPQVVHIYIVHCKGGHLICPRLKLQWHIVVYHFIEYLCDVCHTIHQF